MVELPVKAPRRREKAIGIIGVGILFGLGLRNSLVVSGSYTNGVIVQQAMPMDGISGTDLSPLEQYLRNPLAVPPKGSPPNLPGLQQEKDDLDRSIYGGKGDSKHLGGFTDLDLHGVSPAVWKYMIETIGVRSVLDIGCGRGISTSWFGLHGCKVLCVEGSHDAVERSLLPEAGLEDRIVEHDFSRGPWWPSETYDMSWAVEFLEHVGINHQFNYIATMRKSAIILATSSRWGGWHHVEVHQDDWWVKRFELQYGFRYSSELTEKIRDVAKSEIGTGPAPNGENYNAQHVWLSMKVFLNPAVAALPQHAQLFFEQGCFATKTERRKCGVKEESALPDDYYPLKLTQEQDDAWVNLVRKNTKPSEVKRKT
jgi:SAM-dependent methyltransferase